MSRTRVPCILRHQGHEQEVPNSAHVFCSKSRSILNQFPPQKAQKESRSNKKTTPFPAPNISPLLDLFNDLQRPSTKPSPQRGPPGKLLSLALLSRLSSFLPSFHHPARSSTASCMDDGGERMTSNTSR